MSTTSAALPKGDEYVAAVQHPTIAFRDNELARGTFETNANGLPRPYSGGFTRTFHALGTTGEWAVRCFTREVRDLARRYDAIGRFSSSTTDPAFVRAELIPAEILAAGRRHPVIKMDWIRAPQLNVYVDRNFRDAAAMNSLAEGMLTLGNRLDELGIAHGDLQHGNILVTSLGSLRLVDYDDLYLPELADLQFSSGLGHPNYQHPGRTSRDFGPAMDRFSLFAIYIALLALAEKPALWHEYEGGDESILFKREDFADPEGSPLFAELAQRDSLAEWIDRFAAVCHGSYADIPAAADFVAGRFEYGRFVPGGPRPEPKSLVSTPPGGPSSAAGSRAAEGADGRASGRGTAAGTTDAAGPASGAAPEQPEPEPEPAAATASWSGFESGDEEPVSFAGPSLRDRIAALTARLLTRSVLVRVASIVALVIAVVLVYVFRNPIGDFIIPPAPGDSQAQNPAPPPRPAHRAARPHATLAHHPRVSHALPAQAAPGAALAQPIQSEPAAVAHAPHRHAAPGHHHARVARTAPRRAARTDAASLPATAGRTNEHRPADATAALLDAAAGGGGAATGNAKCPTPDAPARVLTESVPATAKFSGAVASGGAADVVVSLTPDSAVASAYIATSSGSADLDAAALDAAKRSTYSTQITNCTHVAASVTVHVRL